MKKPDSALVSFTWKPDKTSKTPIYKQIEQYVIQKIVSGEWVTGNKLPPGRDLCTALGVNRSTIAEAMAELKSKGFIETKPGVGTVILYDTWSGFFRSTTPDWKEYIDAGLIRASTGTVKRINEAEYQEGVIRLSTGEISPELFPLVQMNETIRDIPAHFSNYNSTEPLGLRELRELICQRLRAKGIRLLPECILVVSGSIQALQLISAGIMQKGSTLFLDEYSYLNSLQIFQSNQILLRNIPLDREGVIPWMIEKNDYFNNTAMVYTIPNYQNPTGVVMTGNRRKELLHFCTKKRIPIIEDDAYGDLFFDTPPPAPLKASDASTSILYVGTLSKTLSMGMRIGWLVGPTAVINRLSDIKMQFDYGASALSQWAAIRFIKSGKYDEHLVRVRGELKKRRDILIAILQEYFHDIAQWDVPEGGFYLWLSLKKTVNMHDLFEKACGEGILFTPGYIYTDKADSHIRLSFAYEEPGRMRAGLQKLSELIRRY